MPDAAVSTVLGYHTLFHHSGKGINHCLPIITASFLQQQGKWCSRHVHKAATRTTSATLSLAACAGANWDANHVLNKAAVAALM